MPLAGVHKYRYGSQDATGAIQAWVTDAYNQGFPSVYIPAGLYQLLGKVNVPAGMLIYGDGEATVLYRPGVLSDDPAHPDLPMINWQGDGIRIKALTFLGDNGDAAGVGFVGEGFNYQSAAIEADHDMGPRYHLSVEDCFFKNLYGFSIQCSVNDYYTKLINNRCLYNANGMNMGAYHAALLDNFFLSAEGIELLGYDSIVRGNQILGAFNGGISFYGRGCTVEKNVIDMRDSTSQTGVGGIGISVSGAYDGKIIGNDIIDPRTAGISVFLSPGGIINNTIPSNLLIQGNNIRSDRLANSINAPTGIAVANSRNINIKGNGITGLKTSVHSFQIGVQLIATDDSDIEGNTLDGLSVASIYLDQSGGTKCTRVLVRGNPIRNPGVKGIYLASTNKCQVANNSCEGASDKDLVLAAAATGTRYVSTNNVFGTTQVDGTVVP